MTTYEPENGADPGELQSSFIKLYQIVSLLRSPDGCPWDRKQTPHSLRSNLLEEVYECISAIEENDTENLCEELGDIFLILLLLSRMNEETNKFTLRDVFDTIGTKLIRRHPHVFEKKEAISIPEIIKNWDYIKEHIEGKSKKVSIFSDINGFLPPLEKSFVMQKKAAAVGFDWKTVDQIFPKLDKEIKELNEAIQKDDRAATEEEIGDLLFTIVNVARHLHADPSLALERTNRKFAKRFQLIEIELRNQKIPLAEASFELLDSLWNKVKKTGD